MRPACDQHYVVTRNVVATHPRISPCRTCRAEDCIVTALLHDIVDDSESTLADVEGTFGAEVAALVGAVAQLSRNNQLLRRAHRRMLAQGQHLKAEAEVEAMKSMILQSTDEPMVSNPPAFCQIRLTPTPRCFCCCVFLNAASTPASYLGRFW